MSNASRSRNTLGRVQGRAAERALERFVSAQAPDAAARSRRVYV